MTLELMYDYVTKALLAGWFLWALVYAYRVYRAERRVNTYSRQDRLIIRQVQLKYIDSGWLYSLHMGFREVERQRKLKK